MASENPILQNPEFLAWLSERPERVQEVARRFPPGRYRMKSEQSDPLIAYYIPQSYDEPEDASKPVTLTCIKVYTDALPIPGYGVFGILPEDLIPLDEVPHGE